jgi:hypothetical protein
MGDKPSEDAKAGGFPWITVALGLVGLVLIAVSVPNLFWPRTRAAKPACVANLKQLDGAKEQWALETRHTNGFRLTKQDIQGVLSNLKNSAMPICPRGGTYVVGPIGASPRCSIGGPEHTL